MAISRSPRKHNHCGKPVAIDKIYIIAMIIKVMVMKRFTTRLAFDFAYNVCAL